MLPSVMAAGSRSGCSIPVEGTSAAAPRVLRRVVAPGTPPQNSPPPGGLPRSPARLRARGFAVRQVIAPGAPGSPLRESTWNAEEIDRRTTEANVGAGGRKLTLRIQPQHARENELRDQFFLVLGQRAQFRRIVAMQRAAHQQIDALHLRPAQTGAAMPQFEQRRRLGREGRFGDVQRVHDDLRIARATV
ncbi:hypothetical protein [Candidatus Burkholderia verschuerenii]|uniref:hypothetical protein n=1 Tax=Candidatus Burkholderia verschuerenii TaxID=242163 RepID=UPI00067D439F|nr:hypothetical protein [Candidatus Burkholderia verschuerenii]